MQKKIFLLVMPIVAIGIGLGLSEMILRGFNFLCLSNKVAQDYVKTVNIADPVLGWKNRPGRFKVPFFWNGSYQNLTYTNNADGSRATSHAGSQPPGRKTDKIIIVGGSFVYGENVSDEQTFAWKIQEVFPDSTVLNCGVRAYGTYQSLLMLEKVLPRTESPRIVIYGFMLHHRFRNIAPRNWQTTLNHCASSDVFIPYVSLDKNNRLIRNFSETLSPWPFSRQLKTIYLCELLWHAYRDRDKYGHLDLITQNLILQMKGLCKKYNCRLLVAVLGPLPPDLDWLYKKFFIANNIPAIVFGDVTPNMFIRGHPSADLHSRYAEDLSFYIRPLL